MRIEGKSKVLKIAEAQIIQPYPVFTKPVTINGKTADLAFRTAHVQYVIDGATYNGIVVTALQRLES